MRWLDMLTCWSCDRNLIFSHFISIAHEIGRREQAGRGGVLNTSADVDNREIEQEGSHYLITASVRTFSEPSRQAQYPILSHIGLRSM